MDYDPKTGILTWKVNRGSGQKGKIAGSKMDAYRMVQINGKHYLTHRVIWCYMTGYWSKVQIDHIDGNKSNNIFSNLREATNSENQCNRKNANKNSKSGFKNVYLMENNRYLVQVTKDRKTYPIGWYDNLNQAIVAAKNARSHYHGIFAS